MNTSAEIKQLAAALLSFHKEVGKISKDANNPFFKSKYASLSGILDTISDPLQKNGLTIVQFPEGEYGLTTRLLHSSGEWMESTYFMKPKNETPQDAGSVITYQRRYAIGAILSLNIDEDDDANKGSGRSSNGYHAQEPDDKPWLNENTPEFRGALKKLAAGETTVEKIGAHFKLSKTIKAILTEAQNSKMPI